MVSSTPRCLNGSFGWWKVMGLFWMRLVPSSCSLSLSRSYGLPGWVRYSAPVTVVFVLLTIRRPHVVYASTLLAWRFRSLRAVRPPVSRLRSSAYVMELIVFADRGIEDVLRAPGA